MTNSPNFNILMTTSPNVQNPDDNFSQFEAPGFTEHGFRARLGQVGFKASGASCATYWRHRPPFGDRSEGLKDIFGYFGTFLVQILIKK